MVADTRLNVAGRVALVTGGLLPSIALTTIAIMLPSISDSFPGPANAVFVKMVATALGVGMMVGAPLGGLLGDRIGRVAVLVASSILFGAFGGCALLVTQLWQLVALRFLVGLVTGSLSACFIAVIGDLFSDERQGRWFGYTTGVATVGSVFANPVTGLLVDHGWRYGFLVYLLALPMAVLAAVGIPRTSRPAPARDPAERTAKASGFPWTALFFAATIGTVSTGTSLYWPFRLRELGVGSASELSFYAMPIVAMVAVAGLVYGRQRRTLSVTTMFFCCFVMSATGLLIAAVAPRPWIALLGLLVEAVSLGWLSPNLSVYSVAIAPPAQRARTVGIVQAGLFGSPFLAQFALEPLSQAAGTAAAALFAIATLAGGLALFVLTRMVSHRPSAARSA